MDIIAFPVSFDSTGFRKLEEGTEDYYRQLLTIALLTEPRSTPINPNFGVNDPAFTTIDRGLFISQAAQFVPEVTITSVDVSINPQDDSSNVVFSFQIRG